MGLHVLENGICISCPSERRFDPAEPRDPHSGKWGHGASAATDALKLAGGIDLKDGEHLEGSGKVHGMQEFDVHYAWVSGNGQRQLRLTTGGDQPEYGDATDWAGTRGGQTVTLDADGVESLRGALTEAQEHGAAAAKQIRALKPRWDKLEADSGGKPYEEMSHADKARHDALWAEQEHFGWGQENVDAFWSTTIYGDPGQLRIGVAADELDPGKYSAVLVSGKDLSGFSWDELRQATDSGNATGHDATELNSAQISKLLKALANPAA